MKEYIEESTTLLSAIKYKREIGRLSKETLDRMFGENFNTSISKLEQYSKCSLSYFLKYGLKIEPKKTYSITSLDVGSFMHNVLKEFSEYITANNIAWQAILKDLERYNKALYDIIDRELSKSLGKYIDSPKYVVLAKKLKSTMRKVIRVIATSFNQSSFVPYGYEISFGKKDNLLPIEIELDNGKVMDIVGQIDRADIAYEGENAYLRIVDYKSSDAKANELTLSNIKEGISLQLITYLSALMKNIHEEKGINVIPAGVMYFNLSERITNLKDYIKDEETVNKKIIEILRMKGIFLKDVKIMNLMDSKLETEERLVGISKSSIAGNRRVKGALEEEEFKSLCEEINDILKKIGNEMTEGKIAVNMYNKHKACDYCDYQNICRKRLLG